MRTDAYTCVLYVQVRYSTVPFVVHVLYIHPHDYGYQTFERAQSGHAKYIRKIYTTPKGHRAQSRISQKVQFWKGAQRFEF